MCNPYNFQVNKSNTYKNLYSKAGFVSCTLTITLYTCTGKFPSKSMKLVWANEKPYPPILPQVPNFHLIHPKRFGDISDFNIFLLTPNVKICKWRKFVC